MKASIVSYLNAAPLLYGITQSGLLPELELELDIPSEGASKLQDGNTDLALVPVGAFVDNEIDWVGDYCIGAESAVYTVALMSMVPIENLKRIWLDTHSRTSVLLVKILAQRLWHLDCDFVELTIDDDLGTLPAEDGVLMIGDKVFYRSTGFLYKHDLAEAWIRLTGLPFVFAAWASSFPLDDDFLERFNRAQAFGINAIDEVVRLYSNDKRYSGIDIRKYLQTNISYELTARKLEGLRLFNKFIQSLS